MREGPRSNGSGVLTEKVDWGHREKATSPRTVAPVRREAWDRAALGTSGCDMMFLCS